MKRVARTICLMLWVFIGPTFFASLAHAGMIVLDFEDLAPTGGNFLPMPSGYGGINWSDIYWPYDQPQPPFNPKSGIVRIASNRRPDPTDPIPRGQLQFIEPDVIFHGAWFAGPFPQGSPPGTVEVQFQLFSDGILVHLSEILTVTPEPVLLSSGYNMLVDAVKIVGPEGEYVFDDLSYSVIPIPPALWLFGSGLLGMIGISRRKKAA